MALTITGSDADSYADLTYANAYAAEYFIGDDLTGWNAATDPQKEASLRQATQYLDNRFRSRFVGVIQSESQSLEWPRNGAVDQSGRYINQIPEQIKQATVELAKARIVSGTNLVPDEARGGAIKRAKVGSLEVEYSDNAPAGTDYRFSDSLVSGLLKTRGNRLLRV